MSVDKRGVVSVGRTEDESLDLVLKLARLEGPPQDPRAAVFFEIIQELLSVIHREAPPTRKKAVKDWVLRFVESRLRTASGHPTLGEQERALRRNGLGWSADYGYYPHDLRKARDSRLPPSAPEEYEALQVQIKSVKGEMRRRPRCDRVRRFRELYPHLNMRQARSVVDATPAIAARIVLGARCNLSKSQVDDLLKEQRRIARLLSSIGSLGEAGGSS